MENNFDQIPEFLFDWLESRPYDDLNPEERAMAEAWLDESEYRELQETATLLRKRSASFRSAENQRREVLEALPQKSAIRWKITHYRLPLPYAAALVILALVVWLRPLTEKVQVVEKTQVDTLILPGKEKVVLVHDTVWQKEPASLKRKLNTPRYSVRVNGEVPVIAPDFHVLEPAKLDEAPNRPKNNSLEFDSLAKTIGFVTL